ncbi:MAG: hypothetical protein H6828_07305 [Planctomycetes bacterium]|nr:hypothetical protein [Planctomycetota bacterium]
MSLALLATLALVAPVTELDPAAELAALVRLETPAARAERARELAADASVDLEAWLAAMRDFGTFAAAEPGARVETVELRVGEARERTPLHLLVPEAYDPAHPAPLLLAFHGTGGDGAQMIDLWRGVAPALGVLVVAPSETGKNAGYEFSERERQAALAALRWARLEFNVDEERVFATGVSRGGHLAWDLALRHPGLLAGLAPMIGSPRVQHRLGQNNLRYLENVVDLPIRDLQGADDDPGMVFNLRYAFDRLEALGASDARFFLQEGLGHSFRMSAVDWRAFFGAARRAPFPERVVRCVARPGEGRAAWVEVLETKKPVAEEFDVPLTARWKQATHDEQRVIIQEQADAHTARLEARFAGVGAAEVTTSRGIARFRLLLPADAYEEGKPFTVVKDGKKVVRRPKADKALLLAEFAERFDRTFLPVAEVVVK